MRLLTHHKSQFIYHTCIYNCLYTCISYQIPVLFQFQYAILWNPLESGPIPLDSTGLHWIPLDSTGMTRFQQEQGGHCTVLKNPLEFLKGGLSKLKETVKNRRNSVCECQWGEEMMEINGGTVQQISMIPVHKNSRPFLRALAIKYSCRNHKT